MIRVNSKKQPSIEVSDILAANSQMFTSSFQVRWGQWGQILTADNENAAGYTFDDIHLYEVSNDIQMISIDTPVVASCGLNNAVPVKVTVRNSANTTITNIPVTFQVDGNTPVTETIASIAGNTSISYTFTATTTDLALSGSHTVKVWVDLASDIIMKMIHNSCYYIIRQLFQLSLICKILNQESVHGLQTGKKAHGNMARRFLPRSTGRQVAAKHGRQVYAGNYNDNELSYLYSPCFDITGMTNPTLSLSIALDLEDCGGSLCDGAYVEYSADGIYMVKTGNKWNRYKLV